MVFVYTTGDCLLTRLFPSTRECLCVFPHVWVVVGRSLRSCSCVASGFLQLQPSLSCQGFKHANR